MIKLTKDLERWRKKITKLLLMNDSCVCCWFCLCVFGSKAAVCCLFFEPLRYLYAASIRDYQGLKRLTWLANQNTFVLFQMCIDTREQIQQKKRIFPFLHHECRFDKRVKMPHWTEINSCLFPNYFGNKHK